MSDIKETYNDRGSERRVPPRLKLAATLAVGAVVVLGLLAAGGLAITDSISSSPAEEGSNTNTSGETDTTPEGVPSVGASFSTSPEDETANVFLYRVSNVDHVTVALRGTEQAEQVDDVGTISFEDVDAGDEIVVTQTVAGSTEQVTVYTVPSE